VEDVLKDLRTEVVEHTIHRDYCPRCKKHVEPKTPDALANATIGNNLVALTGWLHYGVGVTTEQVRELVGIHLHTRLSAGGLISCWHRLAEILTPWYRQTADAARASAVLNADETGPLRRPDPADRPPPDATGARRGPIQWPLGRRGPNRLARRLLKHCDSLFTFLDHPEVPYDNSGGERMIRPAVIIRKNSQSNSSDKGAATQAILMSVYRTLKLRSQDPIAAVADAPRTCLSTGQLPPLPVPRRAGIADG
jgi:hypothetical protein